MRLSKESSSSSRSCAQASSGSHPEGCGLGDSGSLRAASARRSGRWKGAWACGYAPLNREHDCSPGLGGSVARMPDGMRGTAGSADGPRAGAFRSDDGTQRSERFGRGSSNRVLPRRHGAEGRHPRRGAPNCGAGVVDGGSGLPFRPRWSRAGRRATHGMRWSRCDRSGRRSNRHAPRVPRWPRERQAPNVRLRTPSLMHERAPHRRGHT
jgi:hypothetical protein